MDDEVVVHGIDEPQREERNIELYLQDAQDDAHGLLVLIRQQITLHERPPGFRQPVLQHVEQVERQGNYIPNSIRVLPTQEQQTEDTLPYFRPRKQEENHNDPYNP